MLIFIVVYISVISVYLIITGKNEAEKRKKLFDEEVRKSSVNMIHKIKKGDISQHVLLDGSRKTDELKEMESFCRFIGTSNFCNIMKDIEDVMYYG